MSCIHNKLDEGNKVLEIFLDVKKAFDCIDHEIKQMALEVLPNT